MSSLFVCQPFIQIAWDLLVFVYFLSHKQCLRPLGYCPHPPMVLLSLPFNVQMVLTVLQQEAVLEELGWARAAAELGLEGLGHGRPVVVLQVRQEKRVFRKRDLAQVALEQVLVLQEEKMSTFEIFFFFPLPFFYPLSSVRHILPSFPHRLAFSTGAW